MKKILMGTALLMGLTFAGASMSATLTINNLGDVVTQGDAGLTDTAVDPNADFNITHTIALNTNAQLLVNSYELINLRDFLVYKLFDGASNLVSVFDAFNSSSAGGTQGANQIAGAGFQTYNLNAGTYYLNITGRVNDGIVAGSTVKGSFHTQITALETPIPAAIWLFGSALMGLVGMSRRKTGLAA